MGSPTRPNLASTFARALRAARERQALTLAEVAEVIGMAVEAYGRLERGSSLPRAHTLIQLARALHVTTDSLLGLEREAEVAVPRAAEAADFDYAGERASPELRRLCRRLAGEDTSTIRALDQVVRALRRGRGVSARRKRPA